ncbi:cupin domain-containing protein, partial [Bacillus velezensis]|uniref:cupin domain-containing protein n=1 Tax=Bacillus velezensis TaxID=492670 RepID=UPI00119FA50A
VKQKHDNFSIPHINHHSLPLALFTAQYHSHHHPHSDQSFIVLERELLIHFNHKQTPVLNPNDTLLIPKPTIHPTPSYLTTLNLSLDHTHPKTLITHQLSSSSKTFYLK